MTTTTTYTERPILFSGPMVRAIQKKQKRQTRRIVKPSWIPLVEECLRVNKKWVFTTMDYDLTTPYGQPGNRLWVRETWKPTGLFHDWIPRDTKACGRFAYAADANQLPRDKLIDWRPSIHMPRWASRMTLDVLDIRAERLQAITEADAKAEGAKRICDHCGNSDSAEVHWACEADYTPEVSYRVGFRRLWDSLNAKRGFGWDVNPLVWVVDFKDIAQS